MGGEYKIVNKSSEGLVTQLSLVSKLLQKVIPKKISAHVIKRACANESVLDSDKFQGNDVMSRKSHGKNCNFLSNKLHAFLKSIVIEWPVWLFIAPPRQLGFLGSDCLKARFRSVSLNRLIV